MWIPRVLVAVVVCTVPLAGGTGVVAASPVTAGPGQCADYLEGKGYTVVPKLNRACAKGSQGGSAAYRICAAELQRIDVDTGHAERACKLAPA